MDLKKRLTALGKTGDYKVCKWKEGELLSQGTEEHIVGKKGISWRELTQQKTRMFGGGHQHVCEKGKSSNYVIEKCVARAAEKNLWVKKKDQILQSGIRGWSIKFEGRGGEGGLGIAPMMEGRLMSTSERPEVLQRALTAGGAV